MLIERKNATRGGDDLKAFIVELGDTVEEFKTKHSDELGRMRGDFEALERKFNKLRMAGSDPGGLDHAALLVKTLKAAFPGRSDDITALDVHEYRKAYARYLRHGLEPLSGDERKALQVGVDTDGGVTVPSDLHAQIIQIETANSAIRPLAYVLPMGAGEINFPAALTRPAAGWVNETGARTETATPGLGAFTLRPGECYAAPRATQKIIDDSAIDMEAFLADQIGVTFATIEDAAFISGDGLEKPRGFTTYATATTTDAAGTRPYGTLQYIATGQSGAWPSTDAAIYDKLVDVVQSLRPAYRKGASWVMGTESITRLMKLKDSQNLPVWVQSAREGAPSTLLGYPVAEAEQMPAIAANSLSVAFGNFKRGYWIGDRLGIRTLRDPYTAKPHVIFYTIKRVDGVVADSTAIKLLKFSAS